MLYVAGSGYGMDDGIFYLLQDHLKSSSVFISRTGNSLGTNYYYPYGANRGGMAFSNLTTKRFTGQYHESSLPGGEGLSYYNARWYDASWGASSVRIPLCRGQTSMVRVM